MNEKRKENPIIFHQNWQYELYILTKYVMQLITSSLWGKRAIAKS